MRELQCDSCESLNVERIRNTFDHVGEITQIRCKNCSSESQTYTSYHECRVCGCSWFNACPNGCYWVEEWLCSNCVS